MAAASFNRVVWNEEKGEAHIMPADKRDVDPDEGNRHAPPPLDASTRAACCDKLVIPPSGVRTRNWWIGYMAFANECKHWFHKSHVTGKKPRVRIELDDEKRRVGLHCDACKQEYGGGPVMMWYRTVKERKLAHDAVASKDSIAAPRPRTSRTMQVKPESKH
jgi:hypothetical protein